MERIDAPSTRLERIRSFLGNGRPFIARLLDFLPAMNEIRVGSLVSSQRAGDYLGLAGVCALAGLFVIKIGQALLPAESFLRSLSASSALPLSHTKKQCVTFADNLGFVHAFEPAYSFIGVLGWF